jgi:hypothetical protein
MFNITPTSIPNSIAVTIFRVRLIKVPSKFFPVVTYLNILIKPAPFV